LVSGALNPHDPPGRILNALLSETFTVLHDDRILSEYREVLLRPAFGFLQSDGKDYWISWNRRENTSALNHFRRYWPTRKICPFWKSPPAGQPMR